MRAIFVLALFVVLIAITGASPTSEIEANNQELFQINADGAEHDSTQREARQFGFGGFGRRFGGGFGGFRGGFGGFRGGFGGFRGGFGRFGGGFGGFRGGFGRGGFGFGK